MNQTLVLKKGEELKKNWIHRFPNRFARRSAVKDKQYNNRNKSFRVQLISYFNHVASMNVFKGVRHQRPDMLSVKGAIALKAREAARESMLKKIFKKSDKKTNKK